MFCKQQQEEVTDKSCNACWKAGQKQVWRKRMVEEYGYEPGRGHRVHLLRRDCRMNYLYDKPSHCQQPIPKDQIIE